MGLKDMPVVSMSGNLAIQDTVEVKSFPIWVLVGYMTHGVKIDSVQLVGISWITTCRYF